MGNKFYGSEKQSCCHADNDGNINAIQICGDNESIDMGFFNGYIYMIFHESDGSEDRCRIPINFCPICGRKFKYDNAADENANAAVLAFQKFGEVSRKAKEAEMSKDGYL